MDNGKAVGGKPDRHPVPQLGTDNSHIPGKTKQVPTIPLYLKGVSSPVTV